MDAPDSALYTYYMAFSAVETAFFIVHFFFWFFILPVKSKYPDADIFKSVPLKRLKQAARACSLAIVFASIGLGIGIGLILVAIIYPEDVLLPVFSLLTPLIFYIYRKDELKTRVVLEQRIATLEKPDSADDEAESDTVVLDRESLTK